MGLFSKSAKDQPAQAETGGKRPDSLYVHLRVDGYDSAILDASGKQSGDLDTGSRSLFREGDNQAQLEASLAELAGQLSSRKGRSIGRIYMLMDALPTLLRDGRANPVNDRDINTLGKQLLHVNEVAWGQAALTLSNRRNSAESAAADIASSRCIAMLDARPLRHLLSGFGEHSARITALVPTEKVLIDEGWESRSQPSMSVYFGAGETRLTMCNADTGAVLVRSLPQGVASLAEAVSEAMGIDAEEVLESFSSRAVLDKLGNSNLNDDSLTTSPIENALLPVLRELQRGIVGSIDYFRDQMGYGNPSVIKCHGEIGRIKGMDAWLQRVTGLKTRPAAQSLLSQYINSDASQLNLLEGCESSLITVGKVPYSYSKGGFVPTRELQQAAPSSKPAGSSRSGGRHQRRSHRRREPASGLSALVGQLFSSSGREDTSEDQAADKVDKPLLYYVLSVLIFSSLIYYGYDEYSKIEKRHNNLGYAYEEAWTQQEKARKQLLDTGFHQEVKTEAEDKVLWTEKFLSLGRHLNERLWITDLYLGEATRTLINHESVVTKRLVIEGAALPSSDGHIAEIARFMAALEADQSSFMDDFSEISFAGSHTDEEDNEDVVRFTLIAWYDENKRLHQEEDRKDEKPSIGNTMKAVGRHNEDAVKAIPGLGGAK